MPASAAASERFERPRLSRLAKILLGLQVVWGGATALLYALLGLTFGGLSELCLATLPALAVVAALFLLYRYLRAGREAWVVSEVMLALLVMLVFTNVGAPSQYVAVALARPLIDPWLAAADAAIGVDVRELVVWTSRHPWLAAALRAAYFTLLPQMLCAVIYVGLIRQELAHLWEYAFHFHFCLVATLLSLALFPAECVFEYQGFESLIDQTRFIEQLEGFRSGALTVIDWRELEGMISMPSFHVAAGLMVTWAVRGSAWALVGFGALNVVMIAATVLCGAHYFVDLVATFVLFALSVMLWRCWVSRLHRYRPAFGRSLRG